MVTDSTDAEDNTTNNININSTNAANFTTNNNNHNSSKNNTILPNHTYSVTLP